MQEYHPLPIAIMIRVLYNVTTDGIRTQLDRGLLALKETLEGERRSIVQEPRAMDAATA